MVQLAIFIFMVCLVCSWVRSASTTRKGKHDHPKILDLVTKRGYPSEIHHVTTSDGYILSMYRIPHGRTTNNISENPVLLLHGLGTSSNEFLYPETTHGLGYVLADNNYDVWLGNSRGTEFSRNHTSLNPDKDSKFWHFSWHEIGMFDLPAMIDYILNVTNQTKLHYVGHSQGTTAFYVLASTRPEYNSKIKAQISLAPITYMNHIPSLFMRVLALFLDHINKLVEKLQIHEFGSSRGLTTKVSKGLCFIFSTICDEYTSIVSSYHPLRLSVNLWTWLRFHQTGSSVRQTLHYLQGVNSKCFHWYDYHENNLEVYGRVRPPAYNLSLVTTSSYLFYSRGDKLVGEVDVFRLCRKIKTACLGQFRIADANFSHVDYVLGVRAPELVYQRMLNIMQKH